MRIALLLPAIAVFNSIASADPAINFNMTACGSGIAPCDVVATRRAPTAAELAGLNQSAFLTYMAPLLNGQTGAFNWSITDSSSSGFVIGSVSGPNSIITQFVFHQGQVVCCSIDEPFRLSDINDNNYIVGFNPGGPPGLLLYAPSLQPGSMTPINYSVSLDPRVTASAFASVSTFTAIDNNNRILGSIRFGGPDFVITPTPEPTSMALFVTAAAVLGWQFRKRFRRGS